MVFPQHGRNITLLAVLALFPFSIVIWRNSDSRLKLQISEIGGSECLVTICRDVSQTMKCRGVEFVDGRKYIGPLRKFSPQFIHLLRENLMDIQLRGGFMHKGLLVDLGVIERSTISHPKFRTRKIQSRIYLYSEL